jgi:hypothetical protein
VPPKARACPACGADHDSGWHDDANGFVDVPEGDFDYDDFIQREFGSSVKPYGIGPVWWVTGIILILALVLFFLL